MRRLSGGREADIFDLGDGTVLRRYKGIGHPEREGMVLEHALRHGFPVPRVVEIRANELVVERIDGRPTGSRPPDPATRWCTSTSTPRTSSCRRAGRS